MNNYIYNKHETLVKAKRLHKKFFANVIIDLNNYKSKHDMLLSELKELFKTRASFLSNRNYIINDVNRAKYCHIHRVIEYMNWLKRHSSKASLTSIKMNGISLYFPLDDFVDFYLTK